MFHIVLNKINKLSLLRALESGRYLNFHCTTKHSWAVKTAIQLEKPRYMIFALLVEKIYIINHI